MDRTPEPWQRRYEDLRAQVLSSADAQARTGWGQALLTHRGVAGWMKAWPKASGPATSAAAQAYADSDTPAVPFWSYSQVSAVLVSIILKHYEEVCV